MVALYLDILETIQSNIFQYIFDLFFSRACILIYVFTESISIYVYFRKEFYS